jgi:hypothetical protein
VHATRVVIISPGDVEDERVAAAEVVAALSTDSDPLEWFLWEVNVAPAIAGGPVQLFLIDPEARIEDSDIVVAIFGRRIGTAIGAGMETGTVHEFQTAVRGFRARGLPHIMAYFKKGTLTSEDPDDLEQYAAVLRFKRTLPPNSLHGEYLETGEFKSRFGKHLPGVLCQVRDKRSRLFTKEGFLAYVRDAEPTEDVRPKILGNVDSDTTFPRSSFSYGDAEKPFWRLNVSTTSGYVPGVPQAEEEYTIYLISDPIRPFEIQIGKLRALRLGKEPKEVPFEGVPGRDELKHLYQIIQGNDRRWLRVVLAELVNDPDALKDMYKDEKDEGIKKLIARNPSATDEVKWETCLFCQSNFQNIRALDAYQNTIIIANDFPFGPFFHYIVFPKGRFHSWDSIEEGQLFGMNWLAHEFLRKPEHLRGAAGIRMGFNSSIRHLVLGKRTRASAGASIAHVHKQIWGMAPGSVNLADHLYRICLAYESHELDYLEAYLAALQKSRLVLWEDENVALYVPFGQIAVHELQIMLKRPGTPNLTELSREEVVSLSRAEFIVARLFGLLDINSFNEVILSLPFARTETKYFRLIATFITREVDLAVSELSLLYVVDRHPYETVLKIDEVWPSRKIEDLRGQRR